MTNAMLIEPVIGSTSFTGLDWAVVVAYFVVTTLIGAKLSGKQSTIRDFFLGGRSLPWYAVAGSSIATEISAITFVSVPFVIFKPGGDFTYLQLGLIGSVLARFIVAYVFVPAYYAREIYSPYDFMGARLGAGVKSMATALFALGGVLGQSARVYLTAIVLELVLKEPLSGITAATGIPSLILSIWIIGIVAVIWTWMGGIATVIWTDVILFVVFLTGGLTAIAIIISRLDGGFSEILDVGSAAGKLKLWDFDPDPRKEFTIWTAAIATTWFNVGIFGTDQLMTQRIFCCKNAREAKKAVLAGGLSVGIAALMLFVGLGLYAFHQAHPLTGESLALYTEKGDRIFPLFILNEIPAGLTGLIIAGIFAAAISSLDSILAALSQTTMSAMVIPRRVRAAKLRGADPEGPAEQERQVQIGRMLVLGYGALLCLAAQGTAELSKYYGSVLQLALALATYVSGALLAGFLLAFLRTGRDGFGFLFSAPLSILYVFAITWAQKDQPWVFQTCLLGGAGIVIAFWIQSGKRGVSGRIPKIVALAVGVLILLVASRYAYFESIANDGEIIRQALSWPWNPCVGSIVAFGLGYFLANRQGNPAYATQPDSLLDDDGRAQPPETA